MLEGWVYKEIYRPDSIWKALKTWQNKAWASCKQLYLKAPGPLKATNQLKADKLQGTFTLKTKVKDKGSGDNGPL